MNQTKKRTKNKQELSPKSGAKKKPEQKFRVDFVFETDTGLKLTNKNARLKIMIDGGISCLCKNEKSGKWISLKGKLLSIKVFKVKITPIKPRKK